MKRILHLLIICFAFYSCEIINPEEDVPSFIEIESFTLAETPDTGSSRQDITEGWVYVNNNLIGAFSKDKPFPVLEAGTVDILIDPGVHENGIAFTPSLYPYYTRYTGTAELERGEVTTIEPVFEYRENTDFHLIEDFETGTLFTLDLDGDVGTAIDFTTDGAFEGSSGIIKLDTANFDFNVATNVTFDLPVIGANDPWLEITFKTDTQLAVGLISQDEFGGDVQLYFNRLNPTADWKKVYLNLKDVVLANPTPPFRVGFGARLASDRLNATVMIDNIKLLTFEQ